jgi:DNA-binding response OmpR family regulator
MARILIVDDEADMRAVERMALEAAGHEVTEAAGGLDALYHLKTPGAFDAVICDVLMPGLSGIKLCQLVRLDPALKGIVFIFVSARHAEEERMEGMAAGADDYLRKPFAFQELWLRLNHHLLEREGESDGLAAVDPLSQLTLPQLVDLVSRHGLSGRLTAVTRFRDRGVVVFARGRMVEAAFKRDTGRPAMRNLMGAELVAFSFEAGGVEEQVALAREIGSVIDAEKADFGWPSLGSPSGGLRPKPREDGPTRSRPANRHRTAAP